MGGAADYLEEAKNVVPSVFQQAGAFYELRLDGILRCSRVRSEVELPRCAPLRTKYTPVRESNPSGAAGGPLASEGVDLSLARGHQRLLGAEERSSKAYLN